MADLAPFRSRLSALLLVSGLLAATITLIEPAKSAITNWSEIAIGFEELLARLALPFAVTFLAIATLAIVLNALAPRRGLALLVALYVALWAQANLFVWKYGEFDGSPIDWGENSGKGILELAFWTTAVALALSRPAWIGRRALFIAGVVFALQLTAVAGLVHDNAPFPPPTDPQAQLTHGEDTDDLSLVESVGQFSRDLNVIIIVLDSLQSDYFAEVIRDSDLRASMPPGFTYYRNATSLYARTEFSLQSMLTARAIPDNVDLRKWRMEHIEQTLPAILSERGFDAVLTTFTRANFRNFGTWRYHRVLDATIAEAGSANSVWRNDVNDLFAIGLFRLSPHSLKSLIYDNGSWRVRPLYSRARPEPRDSRIQYETRTDLGVLDKLATSASADDVAPRFRFLHLYGAHRPYSVDGSCRYAGPSEFKREKVNGVTHCVLSRVFAFLHKLDEIGVYDRSVIFVLADHGGHIPLDKDVASPPLPESEVTDGSPENPPASRLKYPWRGVPLFLAKPLGDRLPLRTSDQPVSLCDVPNSVMDALSIEGHFECESIFSTRVPRQTPRIHYRYPTLAQRRELGLALGDGLPFEKYLVRGHSWRPESWIPLSANAE